MISPNAVFSRSPHVTVHKDMEGLYLIFNHVTAMPYIMNETSHAIWDRCDGGKALELIGNEVVTQYSAAGDSPANDVEALATIAAHIAVLEGAGLLVRLDMPAEGGSC